MTVPIYASAAQIKAVMPDVEFGTGFDTNLESLSRAASRTIDRITKRSPGAYATGTAGTVRYFDGSGRESILVDEMAAAPSKVEVDETGEGVYVEWQSTDYILWPYNAAPYHKLLIDPFNSTKLLWYRYLRSVKITAPWGYSTAVPDDIQQAVITQTIRWFKRGEQGYQDVGAVAELGQLKYVNELDPDIELILFEGGYGQVTI